jgi:hypothetical protein
MKPFFASLKLRIGKVRDDSRNDGYDLWIDETCFPILMRGDFAEERLAPGYLWGIASYRTSLVLNRLLRDHGRQECAYSLEGGNDHHFMFLTPAMHAILVQADGYEKASGPYRSSNRYPNFGLPLG